MYLDKIQDKKRKEIKMDSLKFYKKLQEFDYNYLKTLELKSYKNSQKSFYRKANIIIFKNDEKEKYIKILKSYDIIVGVIAEDVFYYTWEDWSATTGKHVHSFIKAFGLNVSCNKKSLLKNYELNFLNK